MSAIETLEQIQNFKGKYPRQLWYLFFSEMWERFSFYGMRGMLVIFMVENMGLLKKEANLQYGATQAFVYAFTFVGGLLADKILGYRKSLFWGGLLMIVGSIILAVDPKQFFFLGIGFNIIGTGFFKPNISTMVGSLYKEGDPRTDAGFSFFYMGVNLGALIGGYLCIAVAHGSMLSSVVPVYLRWNVAFGFASVVMVISLLTFIWTQKSLGPIGLSPLLKFTVTRRKVLEYITYAASLAVIPFIILLVKNSKYTDIFMFVIGPCALVYFFYEMKNFTWQENKKIIAALIFIVFSIFFWAFFEQSGGSLSFFAEDNLNKSLLGIPYEFDPNGINNSANSLFVIMFAALVGIIWLWMHKKKIEPTTTVKFGLGFLFLAGGFYVFYYTKFFANAQGITSLNVFTLGWLVITFGELCLSPIGMSVMTKLSPQKLQAGMMGMWFLASAYGQYFAGLLGADIADTAKEAKGMKALTIYCDSYKQLALYGLIAGVLLICLSPLIKKLMGGVK
ncbi:MAG: peptide MFS transporter [Bacteroidia bacterium]|nr:peptide MFS transporter [Bacteroidia bacterium]